MAEIKYMEIWERKLAGDPEARRELMAIYYPYCKRIATKEHSRLPSHVLLDDIISYGTEGLIGAIDKFDPYRGIPVEPLIASKVRGKILDEIRSQDWAPRALRTQQKELDRAVAVYENLHGRSPSNWEVAQQIGWSPDEVARVRWKVSTSTPRSLNEPVAGSTVQEKSTAPVDRQDRLPDRERPDDVVMAQAVRDMLVAFIRTLSPQGQLILTMTYFEGRNLGYIAGLLQMPEPKVSALHTELVLMIRNHVRGIMTPVV